MKKIFSILAVSLFALTAFLFTNVKAANAQTITGPYSSNYSLVNPYDYDNVNYNDYMLRNTRGYYNNFMQNYLQNYMSNYYSNLYYNQVMDRNFVVRLVAPNNFTARNVVLMNRDNLSNMLVLRNQITGPFSVNRIEVTVDDASFWRLVNSANTSTNVDVTVDTGNNTVSFNTVAGNVTTGNVNISL